ncbi:MAG: NPCBM/NEW2 domain-containing protein, partial [Bacillota bacterium]|nr:NPCBM/NEW2 domain-containing protein [Bacillota bacterium]
TSSVYIGKHNNSANSQPSSMWLDQLDYFNFQRSRDSDGWSGWDSSKDKDSAGNSYTHGIKYTLTALDKNSQFTEYLLNQKYKQFSGKFLLHYDSRSECRDAYLEVYGDDKLLYTSPSMKAGVLPVDFKVDVSGVIKLKISLKTPNGSATWSSIYYGLTDALLSE